MNRQKITHRSVKLAPLALFVILFTTTNPANMPVAIVLLMAVTVIVLFYQFWFLITKYVLGKALSPQKQKLFTIIATAIVSLMLGLKASGQFTLRDFLTFAAIFAIGWFYIVRFSPGRNVAKNSSD